jgi:hypothetical protein
VDNGLDHPSAEVQAGCAGTDLAYVEDNGPGLDGTPEEIASLFSIRRPMRSSKLLRLPQRGALGNGLRVVSGAVLASGGSLAVITRNLRVELRPEADGSTTVVSTAPVNHPRGTRVEVGFGLAVPRDVDTRDCRGVAQLLILAPCRTATALHANEKAGVHAHCLAPSACCWRSLTTVPSNRRTRFPTGRASSRAQSTSAARVSGSTSRGQPRAPPRPGDSGHGVLHSRRNGA